MNRVDGVITKEARKAVDTAEAADARRRGCALGVEVRPASDSVASKRPSPAMSRASAEASIVPPRIRRRRGVAMAVECANCPPQRWLSIVGIGGRRSRRPVAGGATIGIGRRACGRRQAPTSVWPTSSFAAGGWRGPSPIGEASRRSRKHRGRPVAVLASGDPFHYGIGDMLLRSIPAEQTLCLPQPSAFSLAAARLGWSLQDVSLVSLHGRALEGIVRYLQPGARILALSWDGGTPDKLAKLLEARGLGGSSMTVLEGMAVRANASNAPSQRISPSAKVSPLNTVALEITASPAATILGLATWSRRQPVRARRPTDQARSARGHAIGVGARHGELLWDVGLGAGSIAIEWLLRHPS